jgi:hypothetical protein
MKRFKIHLQMKYDEIKYENKYFIINLNLKNK